MCFKKRRRNSSFSVYIYLFKNQLHAVSSTQLGRQRELSVKILRSPLSAKFRRHCVLRGGTRHSAFSRHQGDEMKMNVSKYFISSSGDRTHNQSILQAHFVLLRHEWPQQIIRNIILLMQNKSPPKGDLTDHLYNKIKQY